MMSSKNPNMNLQTVPENGMIRAISLPAESLSVLTTQIISTGLIIIMVLVLIINAALTA